MMMMTIMFNNVVVVNDAAAFNEYQQLVNKDLNGCNRVKWSIALVLNKYFEIRLKF